MCVCTYVCTFYIITHACAICGCGEETFHRLEASATDAYAVAAANVQAQTERLFAHFKHSCANRDRDCASCV